jgi:FAD/FMN-containing dehydrogenase
MLSDRLCARVVLPRDPDWAFARQAWNLAVDQWPSAVGLPESADDVQRIVALARARGLRIAPQGTGHGALSLGSLEDTILLKTSRMRGVRIDPGARSARVQAGALWGELAAASAEHGLAGLAGSSPTVGVVGYSVGGGLGWLARRHGLASGSIIAAEMVTGDGARLRVDSDHEPDALWAIRGGGGSFAIITMLELALYPIRAVYGGALFWPLTRAREILGAWRAWTASLPDELTSIARLRKMPPRPHIPELLRGRSFVIVEAAYIGAEPEGAELLRPLRALGPELDSFAICPMTDLGQLHMDPPEPMPRIGEGCLLDDLPETAIDAILATALPGPQSAIASIEIRHLEGALKRQPTGPGALTNLDARFATLERELDRLLDALAPWDTGRGYPNFAERHEDARDPYPAETVDRLERIKAACDPDGLIRSNHPLFPTRKTTQGGTR